MRLERLPGERRFVLIAVAVVALSALRLFWALRYGTIGASYQGDEGVRIFDAYQTAFGYQNRFSDSGVLGHAWSGVFGVHPPGDFLVRGVSARALSLIGLSGLHPVTAMFLLSLVSVSLAHVLFGLFARRVAGSVAGFVTIAFLLASYTFNDIKLSAMGEATAAPLVALGLVMLTSRDERSITDSTARLALGGLAFTAASMTRPETAFLLPGICLALWAIIGFRRAAWFGVFAGAYDIAKLIWSMFFAEGLTALNVGDAYFNGRVSLSRLIHTDFIRQLIDEPGTVIFVLGVIGAITFSLFGRHAGGVWNGHLVVASASFSYLAVNVFAQLTGAAPHASYRIVIAVAPFLMATFAIAGVGLWRRFGPALAQRTSDDFANKIAHGSVAIACAFGIYSFATVQVDALEARVPAGIQNSADIVLARSDSTDAVFFDLMRWWENALVAYVSDRDAAACTYSRCLAVGNDHRQLIVDAGEEVVGWPNDGLDRTVRTHYFISEHQPKFIVLASDELRADWARVVSRIQPDDADLWVSHITPYLLEPIDEDTLEVVWMRLGEIRGVEYFEEYVRLVPRGKTDMSVIVEVLYGGEPPNA